MLTVDVAKLSRAELVEAVLLRCSRFGGVKEVTILQHPEKPQIAFALVKMTSDNEVDRIVDNLGAARVGSLAVIRMEQEKAPISPFEYSPRVQPDWAALV